MPGSVQLCSQPVEVPSVAEKMAASLLCITPTPGKPLLCSFHACSHLSLNPIQEQAGVWDLQVSGLMACPWVAGTGAT